MTHLSQQASIRLLRDVPGDGTLLLGPRRADPTALRQLIDEDPALGHRSLPAVGRGGASQAIGVGQPVYVLREPASGSCCRRSGAAAQPSPGIRRVQPPRTPWLNQLDRTHALSGPMSPGHLHGRAFCYRSSSSLSHARNSRSIAAASSVPDTSRSSGPTGSRRAQAPGPRAGPGLPGRQKGTVNSSTVR